MMAFSKTARAVASTTVRRSKGSCDERPEKSLMDRWAGAEATKTVDSTMAAKALKVKLFTASIEAVKMGQS